MNQLSRRAVVTIVRGLAVSVFLLLCGTNCFAQDYPVGILQITSPADGTVVHPGQTVAVTVAPVSGYVFNAVMLVGEGPFAFPAPLYSAPYQFSLTVPQLIAAGKYRLRAIGGRQGQTFGTSNPISLDVEPAAPITKILRVEPATIPFSHPGDVGTLKVFGTFADGSTMDISHSTGTTYTSEDTTAVTVSSNGLVTAVGVGKFGNTPVLVQYGGQQFGILASTRRLAASSASGPSLAQSQPLLQITSPADGTVVNPGQTITVVVTPVSGVTFSDVGLLAADPLIVAQTSTVPPYQFAVTIPQNISAARRYSMFALGEITPGQGGDSYPIDLDVEPAVLISKIRVQPTTLSFEQVGESVPLSVFATFSDGSAWDITHSSGTTYSSADPTGATVSNDGWVTAVGVGKFGNTPILVQYGGQQFGVLASTRRLATSSTPGPSLATLTPVSGALGTSVTLSGANFGTTQGTSTVTFNGTPGTPTSWSSTNIVVPVPSGATTGNVVVTVAGTLSNGLNFTVQGTTNGIALVQREGKDAGTTTTASLVFPANNIAGNWIAVCTRGGLSSSQVFTVTDSNGNKYRQAVQVGFTASAVTLAIYYAENIKGGANTVTVSDTVSGPLRLAILEYTGVATSNSLDVKAAATGVSTSPNSGNATTTASGDLLLGAVATTDAENFTTPTGVEIEEHVPAEPNTKLIAEDKIQASAGTAATSASLAASDPWGAVLAAFKKAHP